MQTYKKLVVTKLSPNFRAATQIVEVPLPTEIKSSELLVKNYYTGVNASDINYTAGSYSPGVIPPFDCGFEALGEVIECGSSVHNLKAGDFVVTRHFGSFAEYQLVPVRAAKKVPTLEKEWIPLDLSGTTASIALDEVVKPQRGERAVVTAAAGGTGHIAVQLLQNVYGCTVVGVCSKPNKAEMLTSKLKCNGVICLEEEQQEEKEEYEVLHNKNLREQIMHFFPNGANIAYESIGGHILEQVIGALALRGRVLSIGTISSYQANSQVAADKAIASNTFTSLPLQLLSKSASLHTFFLPHYLKHAAKHFDKLCKWRQQGLICPIVDNTAKFNGISAIPDAVDHMFARLNNGKVIVEL